MKMSVKLTIAEAREIRSYRKEGQSIANLANTYQVSTTTIWEIIRGTRFREAGAEKTELPVSTGAPIYNEPGRQEHIEARINELLGREISEKEFATLSPEDQVAYASAQMRATQKGS